MPTPASLTNFQVLSYPLGQELEIMWTLPQILPDLWQIFVLKREGSDISQSEIDSYFANGLVGENIASVVFNSVDYPTVEGYSDLYVDNEKQYYYQAVLQDSSDEAVSPAVGGDGTPLRKVTNNIVDAKELVLEAVERVMNAYGMVKDEHYQLLREYALPGMRAPVLYVTRVGGAVQQEFIGHLRETRETWSEEAELEAAGNDYVYGEIEIDHIQVVWEDPNPIRRDRITNIFRAAKESIRQFLAHPNGGGMDNIDILIEGDVINEAVKDRTQVGGMMMISCLISSESIVAPNLASWITGLGTPTN